MPLAHARMAGPYPPPVARGRDEDPWDPNRRSHAWWVAGIGGALWPLHIVVAGVAVVYSVVERRPALLLFAAVFAAVAVFERRRERERQNWKRRGRER